MKARFSLLGGGPGSSSVSAQSQVQGWFRECLLRHALAHHQLKGIENLVGSGPEGIVVLTKDQIGTFSVDVEVFSAFATTSKEDLEAMNWLRSPIGSYDDGQLVVSEDRNTVYIARAGQKREVAPEKAAVWQPSVSNDRKSLVYVRSGDLP
jgi:hypothetical protein